jgi:adenine phosphoribosyltransferase
VEIAGLRRALPIVPVAPSVAIGFLKLYGDAELVEAAASALAESLDPSCEFIVGPEAGGILLAHLLAVRTGLPYAIARKKQRPNMTAPARVQLRSIGTDGWQTLLLGEDDAARMAGRRVAVVDEVISSGGTIAALQELVAQVGGTVIQQLAVATEGKPREDVTTLCHLPLFPVS